MLFGVPDVAEREDGCLILEVCIMSPHAQTDILQRWEGNPVIILGDVPVSCSNLHNCAAVKYKGTYLLLLDIEDLKGHQVIYPARSKDGYRFTVGKEPLIHHHDIDGGSDEHKNIGVVDPRITFLEGVYYITYMVDSRAGFRLALARTNDFKTIENLGYISEPDTKAGALFPEKINGKYARLERPKEGGRIWISYSEDLTYWGSSDVLMSPRPGFWDFHRVGCAVPPFRIKSGEWMLIYYGIKNTSGGPLFRIGAAILDKDDPGLVIKRTNIPILSPRKYYERIGDINNLIYSCGAIVENNILKLYYGAAYSCICLASTSIDEIIDNCLESEKEF